MTHPSAIVRPFASWLSLFAATGALLLAASSLYAQTSYMAVNLSPAGRHGLANAVSGAQAVGVIDTTGAFLAPRAVLWTGAGGVGLHPAFLDDAAHGLFGRSGVFGFAGNLQAGWGIPPNSNRPVALAWRGSAASARVLNAPFTSFGAQALGTDGVQIVGYATPTRDGVSAGVPHALVWNAATGAATDLGDSGNGAQALGVAGGQQVGFTYKSGATLWRGTSNSAVILHPKDAASSSASATDGIRQVGNIGQDVRVRDEAAKGNHTARFFFATLWSGTAASARSLHPAAYTQSFATGIAGGRIVGYAFHGEGVGNAAAYHALVWDANLQPLDLNVFLPAGFTGAQATSIDAQGEIGGWMINAVGEYHAVVWLPNR